MKNTSISLGDYFDQFVSSQVSAGRYKNVSEVIRAGLRLLENEDDVTGIWEDEIEVIRILHERIDLKNRMND